FFQAEDGIRGFHVTGVQTCALPIDELADLVDRTLLCGASPVQRRGIGLNRSIAETVTEYLGVVVVCACVVNRAFHAAAGQVRVRIDRDEVAVELPTGENAGGFLYVLLAVYDIVAFTRAGWE